MSASCKQCLGASMLSLVAAVVAGCASTSSGNSSGDDTSGGIDAGNTRIDASAPVDVNNIDPDAGPGAPDASAADAGCTVQVIQLLTNQNFDATSVGWTQQPTDPNFPIITTPPAAVTAPTAPDVAWFGGLDNGNDIMFEDVAIPAGTTALQLTGKQLVRTSESSATAFDNLTLTIKDTGNVTQATLLRLANANDPGSTTFTTFTQDAPQTFAGQTIRVHFVVTTDSSNPTSFFIDSLALNATVCQ